MSRSFYVGNDVKQEEIHAKYEDGILKGSMEQFSDIDQDFIDSGRVKVYRTDHLFRAKPSSTAKEIKIEVINRFGETYTKTIEL